MNVTPSTPITTPTQQQQQQQQQPAQPVQQQQQPQQPIEQEPTKPIEAILEEFQLFPLLLDIISRLKDDELEVSRAVNTFNERASEALKLLNTLPGVHRSPLEQENLRDSLKLKLEKKLDLIEKLKNHKLFTDQQQQQTPPINNNNNNNNNTDVEMK
ncbi:hypothetical protein DFA_10770 [Cavenderia fasciculata]|uniref:Mediator of RNA polymerase II transcription subunit 9 n=1 Tax=Cavenderia fasciculata TaxID=261658 RepID=F4QBC5_CACFS|nr:uncharacterized protein DFA_10770 [Cavenderia fasciculata]EGG14897.1 hypothetical protein DFA_10770 [Cavenderia fasciculata]|eukprot:XP_004351413.1 hypothetical protein DFA_10770 [Cavenderia fasciculata]